MLHFICLNGNISRQFEFVQNAWLMNSKFNGMTGETDPLLGNREPSWMAEQPMVLHSSRRPALAPKFPDSRNSLGCVAGLIFSCRVCVLYVTLSKPGHETFSVKGSVRRWGGS